MFCWITADHTPHLTKLECLALHMPLHVQERNALERLQMMPIERYAIAFENGKLRYSLSESSARPIPTSAVAMDALVST